MKARAPTLCRPCHALRSLLAPVIIVVIVVLVVVVILVDRAHQPTHGMRGVWRVVPARACAAWQREREGGVAPPKRATSPHAPRSDALPLGRGEDAAARGCRGAAVVACHEKGCRGEQHQTVGAATTEVGDCEREARSQTEGTRERCGRAYSREACVRACAGGGGGRDMGGARVRDCGWLDACTCTCIGA